MCPSFVRRHLSTDIHRALSVYDFVELRDNELKGLEEIKESRKRNAEVYMGNNAYLDAKEGELQRMVNRRGVTKEDLFMVERSRFVILFNS